MVVTVGFFDGVHMGHRRVLQTLCSKGEEAAVVTFWPHPRVVLQNDARGFSLLTSIEEKTALIRECGLEDIRCMEFTRELAALPAEVFVGEYLIKQMGCTRLVLGYDNRLGSDAMRTEEIAVMGEKMGLRVEIVPPYMYDGFSVSSTRIRNCLADGDVSAAASMLGYRYKLSGMVVPGNGLGRTIGFPTANLAPSFPLKIIPANGVYATEVIVGGRTYRGMTNIGVRPTLGENLQCLIETNIFDFDEDIYGMEIQVCFIAKIRSEQRFPSLDELRRQLTTDRHHCFGCN